MDRESGVCRYPHVEDKLYTHLSSYNDMQEFWVVRILILHLDGN
jgi:hypothetical protein